jgi:hypothetical protein
MAELADAADSKSADLRVLGVRLPLPAPTQKPTEYVASWCQLTERDARLEQTQRISRHIRSRMKIYPIEIIMFIDLRGRCGLHFSYTFSRFAPPFKRINMAGLRINLGGKGHVLQVSKPQPVVLKLLAGKKNRRPSQSLSWEVVDGEGSSRPQTGHQGFARHRRRRHPQVSKACESSTLSARTMFSSRVELSLPTSIRVSTPCCGMTYCNTFVSVRSRPY